MAKSWSAKVFYPSNPEKVYTFRTMIGDLQPGDMVIADANTGLGVAIFHEYGRPWSGAARCLIAKVDPASYEISKGAHRKWCNICGDELNEDGTCPECDNIREERERDREDVVIID
jgi:hypothetical protein